MIRSTPAGSNGAKRPPLGAGVASGARAPEIALERLTILTGPFSHHAKDHRWAKKHNSKIRSKK
jgi:hypothetical protein